MLQLKANSHATRLNMLISLEADEHVGDASMEDDRPGPAQALREGRYFFGVDKERG